MSPNEIYQKIQTHLNKYNLVWTGYLYDDEQDIFRVVEDRDLSQNGIILLRLVDDYIYYDIGKSKIRTLYTIDDITNFMVNKFHMYWEGTNTLDKKVDETFFFPSSALSKTTRTQRIDSINLKSKEKERVYAQISSIDFKVEEFIDPHSSYFVSYSSDWRDFLLKSNTVLYSPIYVDYYLQKYKQIQNSATPIQTGFIKKKLIYDKETQKKLDFCKDKIANMYKLISENSFKI